MKVVRRVTLFGVLPLVLVLAAGYGWYQWSDTGKGWRYEDKLASYCDGLIPYAESAVFTDLNTEVGLSRDLKHEAGDESFDSCAVADMRVTVGLVADDSANSVGFNMLDMLHTDSSDYLPVALGGGWQGYTDMRNTAVVLPCQNTSASLVVSIATDESHEDVAEARAMGELAAATARKAAEHWSCEGTFGGRIPKVSLPAEHTFPDSAAGTCEGVPSRALPFEWVMETTGSSSAPLERCALSDTMDSEVPSYYLDASFGPFAQRLRTTSDDLDGMNGNAGIEDDMAWGTASCPGTAVRALFSIEATQNAAPTKSTLLSSLRPFAERSAARHRCTDVELPA
ncbi:hypothetical protein AB0H86_42015 [Streptomyces sp. NPDC050997]|uniref:hypothetical protein n=1 Tax=Streptomyces sp. NPDC050997 TaxID=3155519 RepID=UPI0034384D26